MERHPNSCFFRCFSFLTRVAIIGLDDYRA
jgi:hypothetical protein